MRGFRSCAARALPAYKEKGAVCLQTEHGDTFYTSRLVNAAGPWSSDISRMVGIDLPVARAFQQIFVTDPLPGSAKRSRLRFIPI